MSGGFFGKMPSRGDFVRFGLPTAAVSALDAWCQDVLPASRERLAGRWTEAWMSAPIWRFRLRAGACGPGAVAGIWLPSTDRAGRLFPLVLASWGPGLASGDGGLDALERLGLSAIEHDVSPDQLGEAIGRALAALPPAAFDQAEGEWSTAGGPYVVAARRRYDALPGPGDFAAMLLD